VRGDERVAGFLLETARRAHKNGNGDLIDMPVSRTDLAHHLALNPDTLSRVVSRFNAQGLIAMPSRRSFRILDAAGLAEVSPIGRM
ncbi:helix-turn-helix domain-containing protein, partial [Escherichia coli]|uniref:helix-turn-helix domain-containing protein n=1 Tax=Escherichia coli TaxID=562 RepID=UPI003CE50741